MSSPSIEDRIGTLETEIQALTAVAESEERKLTDGEAEQLAERRQRIEALQDQLQRQADADQRRAAVESALSSLRPAEPQTTDRKSVVTSTGYSERDEIYYERSEHSFIADVLLSAEGDSSAEERLQRHNRAQHQRDAATGSFPGLVPPQYLINESVTLARAGRPFANACRRLPLPQYGMAININQVTTGTTAAVQTAQNAGVSEQDMAGSNVTININTIAGAQELSRQAIDRGHGVDRLIMEDLAEEMETALDKVILNGTGANGQPDGLLKDNEINSANALTKDDSSATAGETYAQLIATASKVVETRFRRPDFFVLHPRRLAYILAGLDTTGRPLWQAGIGSAVNVVASPGEIAYGNTGLQIAGIPVISDANLPTNLGTGTNEDPGIAVYRNDCILWESPPMIVRTDTNLAKNIGHTMVMHRYFAFKLRNDRAAAYSIGSLFEVTL